MSKWVYVWFRVCFIMNFNDQKTKRNKTNALACHEKTKHEIYIYIYIYICIYMCTCLL